MTTRRWPRWSELQPLLRPASDRATSRTGGLASVLRRRPAGAGPAPGTTSRVRLHRRCRRTGDRAAPVPRGVRAGRVPAAGAPGRLGRRHLDDDPRAALRCAAGLRAHRVHPDDAHRGRAGGRPGRGSARASRTPCPRWAPRPSSGSRPPPPSGTPVVPAVPVAGPGGEPGLRRTRPGLRLRGTRADRRRPGRGAAPARRPQRPHHPAVPDPVHVLPRGSGTRPGGST